MTRRAFRPSVSAGAGTAPGVSKTTEIPCCAFGSIAVLILLCLSRARGGREATLEKLSKKVRRELRAVKLVFRVLRLGGSEGEKHAGAAGTLAGPAARVTVSSQAARRYTQHVPLSRVV